MNNKPEPVKTLLSAVEMELFTELARHPEDLPALQRRLGLHPRASADFLDALVALVFQQRMEERYQNTPETDLFLDKNKPAYIRGLIEMANHRLYPKPKFCLWDTFCMTGTSTKRSSSSKHRVASITPALTAQADARNWLQRNACGAPGRSGFHGHRYQVAV